MISIALQADYVTAVEDKFIDLMDVKYCLPVPVFHFWPKLTHPAVQSLWDSWASCYTLFQDPTNYEFNNEVGATTFLCPLLLELINRSRFSLLTGWVMRTVEIPRWGKEKARSRFRDIWCGSSSVQICNTVQISGEIYSQIKNELLRPFREALPPRALLCVILGKSIATPLTGLICNM